MLPYTTFHISSFQRWLLEITYCWLKFPVFPLMSYVPWWYIVHVRIPYMYPDRQITGVRSHVLPYPYLVDILSRTKTYMAFSHEVYAPLMSPLIYGGWVLRVHVQFGKEIVNIMSSENILSQFWDLASNQEETRLKAALQLLSLLREAQNKFEENQAVRRPYTRVLRLVQFNHS